MVVDRRVLYAGHLFSLATLTALLGAASGCTQNVCTGPQCQGATSSTTGTQSDSVSAASPSTTSTGVAPTCVPTLTAGPKGDARGIFVGIAYVSAAPTGGFTATHGQAGAGAGAAADAGSPSIALNSRAID